MNALAEKLEDGALLGGRYELVAELASGGMATVYLARSWHGDRFERWCAIKRLHPHLAREREYIEMFIDEARVAGRIHHPNVIETLAAARDDDGSHFLVMQYVAGEQLAALLRSVILTRRRVTPSIVLRIVVDALAGLSAAHGLHGDDGQPLGLVHRDISPHNILVGDDGIARLTDFGIAKAEGRLHSTRSNVVKGKLAYMSPEQLSGKPLDQRADVFAMGVVLWDSLTHRRLFASDDPADVIRRVLHDPIPLASSVRSELAPLDAVLAKALCRDPDGRHGSAAELARELERVAPAVGGLASRRAVAKLVEVVAKDKLELERGYVANAPPRPLMNEALSTGPISQMRTRVLGRRRELPSASGARRVVTAAVPQRSWLASAAVVLLCGSLIAPVASDRDTLAREQARFERDVAAEPRSHPLPPPLPTAVPAATTSVTATAAEAAPESDVAPPARRARHRARIRRVRALEPDPDPDPDPEPASAELEAAVAGEL